MDIVDTLDAYWMLMVKITKDLVVVMATTVMSTSLMISTASTRQTQRQTQREELIRGK